MADHDMIFEGMLMRIPQSIISKFPDTLSQW